MTIVQYMLICKITKQGSTLSREPVEWYRTVVDHLIVILKKIHILIGLLFQCLH
uniref:Uncharacterized protein n=1 Tax=Arundo donax TaxID=35708 RepID=A0A0A9AVE6_ARUDO